MPLRSANEPIAVSQVLQNLLTVMITNTALQAAGGTTQINKRDDLYVANAVWPALVIDEGQQSTARIGVRLWQSKLTVDAVYYNRWDQNQATISTIWTNIDTDLRRMKANLEDNPRLVVNGTASILDIAHVALSPFQGQVNENEFSFIVVERALAIQLNLPPYVSAM